VNRSFACSANMIDPAVLGTCLGGNGKVLLMGFRCSP
jgi:hypothetical protein